MSLYDENSQPHPRSEPHPNPPTNDDDKQHLVLEDTFEISGMGFGVMVQGPSKARSFLL